MRITAACFVFAITLPIGAQVPPKYYDFGEGPARHLMLKDEIAQWKQVRTDQEAEAFIALFWAKRDPTPATMRNEFREEFDQRVRFADENFGSGRTRGSMSDPGRALILLGPPYRVTSRAGKPAPSMGTFGGTRPPTDAQGRLVVGQPTTEPNQQYWMYAHERKPNYVNVNDFTLVFADVGQNDWQLAVTERVNPERIFQQAVFGLIVSPNLTKPPEYTRPLPPRVTVFKNGDLKKAYEEFRAGDKPSIGAANVTWGEFVTSEGDHYVAAQLYVASPADIAADKKVTSFAVVENSAGEIVDIKEDETTMIAAGADGYVERSLQLPPGTYTTTLGMASGGRVIAASRTAMNVEGLDPRSAGVSPLLLASIVYTLPAAPQPMDPFTFGGLKVVPKGDFVFAPKGDLWYFVELRNPGKTDTGTPNVRVQIDIAGKTSKGPVEMRYPMKDASLAKLAGEPNRYAIGLAIPLEGFVPGEYTMKVHVIDVALGKDYELQKPFRVRG